MSNLVWTKEWSSTDNGTIITGVHLQDLQNDIASILNGGLTNINFDASAALAESKIAFAASGGHTHNGTDSTVISATKHYRKGLTISVGSTADEDIVVNPGVIDIGGVELTAVAASSSIDINDVGNWVSGSAVAANWCYVYAYDNSGTLAFKLSDEAPDLSFDDDTTAEYPLRYQKYSSVYYRCIGAVYIDAAGDLCWGHSGSEGKYVSQFDASNFLEIGGKGTGADQTISTLWTPSYVKVIYGKTDSVPATTEDLSVFEITKLMLDSNWAQLNAMHDGGTHDWIALTTAGCINAVTAQSAGTAGSFTIDAMTDEEQFYAIAYTDVI